MGSCCPVGRRANMSQIQCRVGEWVFRWKAVPRGMEGTTHVEIRLGDQVHKEIEIHWKRDSSGIWISLPQRLIGFNLSGSKEDESPMEYEISQRGVIQEWSQISLSYGAEEVQVASLHQSKTIRVRAQMPGKIIRVVAKEGQLIQKGQSLVVMEAMKMENEIRASQAGKITQVKVLEGQTVETGADLILMESGAST